MMNYSNYLFPIASGKQNLKTDDLDYLIHDVKGTAFSIGNNKFMTAYHVIKDANEFGLPLIGFSNSSLPLSFSFLKIESYEYIEDYDIAIFTIDFGNNDFVIKTLKWKTDNLAIFSSIKSIGYPYSTNMEKKTIHARGYQGSVVTVRTWDSFTDYLNAKPYIVEVGFICPKGLSGAPFLSLKSSDEFKICGVVLGNIGEYAEKILEEGELTDDGLIIQETNFFHGFGLPYEEISNLIFPSIKIRFEKYLLKAGLI